MEKPFEKLDAVYAVISGYSGGQIVDPTYRQVSAGTTGHAEVVLVEYDAAKISYEEILEVFWRQINPTDAGGQFVDRGSQYRSEIFYLSAAQKAAAEQSKAALMASGRFDKPIQTGITKATKFYPAEEYHQDYYKKEPAHYHSYRRGSGRDRYLDRVWGKDRIFKVKQRKRKDMEKSGKLPFTKPSDEELQKMLTSIQYRVTQLDGTESAFKNSYWDNKRAGIYVDIVSGEALFSSKDKFDSKSGWPSFTRPLAEKNIKESTDNKIGYARTEIRSIKADSHLGHLFNDGPAPTGKRYCINSAALRFVPVEDLEKAGYGSFMKLFK